MRRKWGGYHNSPLCGAGCSPLRRFSAISQKSKNSKWQQCQSGPCIFRIVRHQKNLACVSIRVGDLLRCAFPEGWAEFKRAVDTFANSGVDMLSSTEKLTYLDLNLSMGADVICLAQAGLAKTKLFPSSEVDLYREKIPIPIDRRRAICTQKAAFLVWITQTRTDCSHIICELSSSVVSSVAESTLFSSFVSQMQRAHRRSRTLPNYYLLRRSPICLGLLKTEKARPKIYTRPHRRCHPWDFGPIGIDRKLRVDFKAVFQERRHFLRRGCFADVGWGETLGTCRSRLSDEAISLSSSIDIAARNRILLIEMAVGIFNGELADGDRSFKLITPLWGFAIVGRREA